MNIKDSVFQDIVKRIEAFEERLYSHPLHNYDDLDELYEKYSRKQKVRNDSI